MLGFFPLSTTPISALLSGVAPPPVVNKGGAPNYQYPGEADAAPSINALFNTTDAVVARRRRLDETRRALGLVDVPRETLPDELVKDAPPPPTVIDTAAADAATAALDAIKAGISAAQAQAEKIARDDGEVLMLLAALL